MSSYHTSFGYNGKNSAKDYGLIITSFEPDNGFVDSFLAMENVSDEYFDRTKQFNYGSKYASAAEIQITIIKHDGTDMSLGEFRACAKWLTGARVDSWLDMYAGNTIVYSFLGKFTNFEQYKLDGRTVGGRATFSSVSPWAYSAPQRGDCSLYQMTYIDEDGVFNKGDQYMNVFDGVLCASTDEGSYFNITDDGIVYLDTSYKSDINNKSDDLYTYIYLDIDYMNESGTSLTIKNITLDEETVVTGLVPNESISISAKQFITSSIPNKIFGDNFNFVWPRLQPGINDFIVSGNGRGLAQFTYRYPMKVGDCTMDIDVVGGGIDCGDCGEIPSYNTIRWEDIVGVPTTLSGYGITDVYTSQEVDNKLERIDIEWDEVTNKPTSIDGYGITDVYTKDEVEHRIDSIDVEWSEISNKPTTIDGYGVTDVYTKTEVEHKIDNIDVEWSEVANKPTTLDGYEIADEVYTKTEVYTKAEVDKKIDEIEISGGGGTGGGSTNIDEDELNSMLDDIFG